VYSFCAACGLRLQPIDLIPVLSWLWLRGRCRHCKSPIGVTLLAIELLTSIAGTLLVYSALA
jgi:leader peptidase (prepilin peptidase)/N-methyltransferase